MCAKKSKLLSPDYKKSLFKVKIYYADGGEKTYFSYDFEHERKEFEERDSEDYIRDLRTLGYQFFGRYNGFRKQYEHVDKVVEQGLVVRAIIYANQVYEQNQHGFMPMRILQINTEIQTSVEQ